jgi:hypothetical protein
MTISTSGSWWEFGRAGHDDRRRLPRLFAEHERQFLGQPRGDVPLLGDGWLVEGVELPRRGAHGPCTYRPSWSNC